MFSHFVSMYIMWSHRNPTWHSGYHPCDWQFWRVWRGGVSFYGKCSVVIRNFHQSHHLMDLNLQKQNADTHMEAFGRLALIRFTVASSIMDATFPFSLAQSSKFSDSSRRHRLNLLLFKSALFSTVVTRATNACRRIEQFFLNSCSTRFILARGSSLMDAHILKRMFSL